MRKFVIILAISLVTSFQTPAEVTLDYCLDKALENYPLIKKYGIVEKTSGLSLSDINKSWLPRVEFCAQATVQNAVPEFPQALRNVLVNLGQDARGLGHLQYKAGVELSQTIWDGGISGSRIAVERASAAEREAVIDVEMYAVREKVMDLYFSILLMESQIAQSENAVSLLNADQALMRTMLKEGVAMQCDVDMIEAQILTTEQRIKAARSAAESCRRMLSLYVGENIEGLTLQKPEPALPAGFESARPEMRLFDARRHLDSMRSRAVESTVMPRIGFFAQAYCGYPGFNYFDGMMSRNLSLNFLAGVRLTWNIDSFYTKKNSIAKFSLAEEDNENDREIFLFNTRVQAKAQMEEIEGLRSLMADDARIVELRGNVRRVAESQLKNGVIDVTALLARITDENQAQLMACYHEIQLIQSLYKLKNTLNR